MHFRVQSQFCLRVYNIANSMKGEMNWETREKDSNATMQTVLEGEKKIKIDNLQ